jgi:hypothetical protein
MTEPERDDFLTQERTCRVASVGPDGRPHVSPLWFVWVPEDGDLWLYSIVRSRRWAGLGRTPWVSVVMDAGVAYDELRGVELSGAVEMVGEIPRAGEPVTQLDEPERRFAEKYNPGASMNYDGRHAWLRLRPDTAVSWDFRKLATLPPRR